MKSILQKIIHKIGKIVIFPFLEPEFSRILKRIEKIEFELHPGMYVSSTTSTCQSSFADTFRGTEEYIKNRHKIYIPRLKNRRKVIDIGCGRGELLELLKDNKIPYLGIDNDETMIKLCKEKKLFVVKKDAFNFLKSEKSSPDAIIALQFIEHLSQDQLENFINLCSSKLPSKGILVIETINPHCFPALKMFYTDLSHTKPIFPEVLKFLLEKYRFKNIEILYLHSIFGSSKQNSPTKRQVNIFEYADYAAFATK